MLRYLLQAEVVRVRLAPRCHQHMITALHSDRAGAVNKASMHLQQKLSLLFDLI